MPSFWLDHDANDEERLFRQSIRKFVEDFVNPLELDYRKNPKETTHRICSESMKRGIRTLGIPEKYGGQSISNFMRGIASEEIGRSLIREGGPLVGNELHFANKCPEFLVEKWLQKILFGDIIIGIASTEPKSGSDVASIETTAKKRGNKYVINGEKGPVSGISRCGGWIVIARTDDSKSGSRGISEIFVEDDLPGVERTRFDSMDDSWDLGLIKFSNVEVPTDHLIGLENEGFRQRMTAFDIERVSLGAIGAAMHSLELTVQYSKDRMVWGKPIAAFEGVMFPLVDEITKMETVRSFCYNILRRFDAGEKLTKESAMFHWYVNKVVLEALDTCIQVNGAQGFTDSVPHQRRYRRQRGNLIGHGTVEIQKLIIGREIWGREIYELALGRALSLVKGDNNKTYPQAG